MRVRVIFSFWLLLHIHHHPLKGNHHQLYIEKGKFLANDPKLRHKVIKGKFMPYSTQDKLDMIGRTKVILRDEAGDKIDMNANTSRGGQMLILGLKDSKALGIVMINKEGDRHEGISIED